MIAIIGAGPAGCYLGHLLAKAGKAVTVFEEHKQIGLPVQCTGLVSRNLFSEIEFTESFVVNKVYGANIYAPSGEALNVKTKEVQAYIICRTKFDGCLAEKAVSAGAKLYCGKKFLRHELVGDKIILRFADDTSFECSMLIGADGPLSSVAKQFGLYGNRRFWTGVQATVKHRRYIADGNDNDDDNDDGNDDDNSNDVVELYLGSAAPGFFGWSVPEGNGFSRVGLAGPADTVFQNFNSLMSMLDLPKETIIERQGGLIPIYDPNQVIQCRADNGAHVFLLGDAALQVKATTGGGIVHGMIAARTLKDCIVEDRLDDYTKRVKKATGRDLWLTLIIRKYLNKMTDDDYNSLISYFNSGRAGDILKNYGDMDFPSRFLARLLFNEPRFLKFAKLLWQKPAHAKVF